MSGRICTTVMTDDDILSKLSQSLVPVIDWSGVAALVCIWSGSGSL